MFNTLGLEEAIVSTCRKHADNTYNQGQPLVNRMFILAHWLLSITCKYLEFDQGVPSDHQKVWMDIFLHCDPINYYKTQMQRPIHSPMIQTPNWNAFSQYNSYWCIRRTYDPNNIRPPTHHWWRKIKSKAWNRTILQKTTSQQDPMVPLLSKAIAQIFIRKDILNSSKENE